MCLLQDLSPGPLGCRGQFGRIVGIIDIQLMMKRRKASGEFQSEVVFEMLENDDWSAGSWDQRSGDCGGGLNPAGAEKDSPAPQNLIGLKTTMISDGGSD